MVYDGPYRLYGSSKEKPVTGTPHPELVRSSNTSVEEDVAGSKILPMQQLQDRPGRVVLTVTLYEAKDLSAPDLYKQVFEAQRQKSIVQREGSVWTRPSYQPDYKPWLPYAVLSMGQSQASAASIAGTTENPIWAGGAILWKFDVAYASELAANLYLRSPDSSLYDNGKDILLGVVKVHLMPPGELPAAIEWLDVQRGTGQLRIGVEYSKNTTSEMKMDVEHGTFSEVGQVENATVWRKKDTQQLYALKKIQAAESFAKSCNLGFQINSSFIAPLMFACQSSEALYLLSPFVTGGNLFYYLQMDQRFDVDRSRFYAAEILCALDYLHQSGILYYGLGPKNVILSSTGHITMVGFGLLLGNKEHDKERIGKASLRYQAPEVLLSQNHSKAADWWTLGAFLHEMLTGLPPFYDEDVEEMRRKILEEPLQLPASLPPSAQDILSKMLSREPEERLGAKGAVKIKAHSFFDGIDWEKLMRREYIPTFKPHRPIAHYYEEPGRVVTWAEHLEFFSAFKYTEPVSQNAGEIGNVSLEQVSTTVKDSDSPSAASGKHSIPKSPTPRDATVPPRTSAEEDLAWVLVWEEVAQEFHLYNRLTNAKQTIKARLTDPMPKPTSQESSLASHTALKDVYDVPTQSQKERAIEAILIAGYTHVIPQLLQMYGMDLNIRALYSCQTPVEWATQHEDLDLVKLFLDYGSDPGLNYLSQGSPGALVWAVEKRNQELVHLLLPKSGRILCTRALGRAVDQQDLAMVTLLLTNGAKCDFEESDRPRPAHTGEGCFFEDISYPREYYPPLVRAVKRGNVELVRLLLAYDANANVSYHNLRYRERGGEDELGQPRMACGRVIQLAMDLEREDMVRLLLDSGADIDLAQPVWRHHECVMAPRQIYFKVVAGLRAAVEGTR